VFNIRNFLKSGLIKERQRITPENLKDEASRAKL